MCAEGEPGCRVDSSCREDSGDARYADDASCCMVGADDEVTQCCQPPVACTKEAKACPDGSTVGRGGPDCEFAPCSSARECADDVQWCPDGTEAVFFRINLKFLKKF